jgi:hypothetical protein
MIGNINIVSDNSAARSQAVQVSTAKAARVRPPADPAAAPTPLSSTSQSGPIPGAGGAGAAITDADAATKLVFSASQSLSGQPGTGYLAQANLRAETVRRLLD